MFTDIDFHPYDISWSDWEDLQNGDVNDVMYPHEDTISDIRKVLDEYASPTYPSSKGYEVTIRQRPAVQDFRPLSPFKRVRRKCHEKENAGVQAVAGPSIDYNRCAMHNVAGCNEQDVDNDTQRSTEDIDSGENIAIVNSRKRNEPEEDLPSGKCIDDEEFTPDVTCSKNTQQNRPVIDCRRYNFPHMRERGKCQSNLCESNYGDEGACTNVNADNHGRHDAVYAVGMPVIVYVSGNPYLAAVITKISGDKVYVKYPGGLYDQYEYYVPNKDILPFKSQFTNGIFCPIRPIAKNNPRRQTLRNKIMLYEDRMQRYLTR
ncbi:Uncharacterized protein FWK35_00038390 [Aphis craccivora]|uniref:Uncharacterized protein n=1 Tax=Aphis craccivora TaxID=307492 RepID=A0A6G0VPB1_APHCR|nr:Uncharacterized protein FWK35_00038390 [Aphis craccivora]